MDTAKKTHIVHIIPTLRYGGAERLLVSLVNSSSSVFRHSIIALFDDNPLQKDLRGAVDVRVVPKKGRISLHLFRDLEQALREAKPDVVHTHLSGGDIWGVVAAKRHNLPVVSTQHNMVDDVGYARTQVMRRLRQRVDAYVACSKAVQESLARTYHIDQTQIHVIPNGISLDCFVTSKPPAWQESISFLMIGRLEHVKGFDLALRALATIAKTPWSCTIVGKGDCEHNLSQMAQQLGIANNITVVEPGVDVPSMFAKADIVLVPSRSEGFGVVAAEAMAAGRLVIASDADGLQEIVTNEQTGLVFPSEKSDVLADRIAWALAHKEQSMQMAAAAQAHAKKHFGIDRMVGAYELIYDRLVVRHREE